MTYAWNPSRRGLRGWLRTILNAAMVIMVIVGAWYSWQLIQDYADFGYDTKEWRVKSVLKDFGLLEHGSKR